MGIHLQNAWSMKECEEEEEEELTFHEAVPGLVGCTSSQCQCASPGLNTYRGLRAERSDDSAVGE